jgi:hypothetical protein
LISSCHNAQTSVSQDVHGIFLCSELVCWNEFMHFEWIFHHHWNMCFQKICKLVLSYLTKNKIQFQHATIIFGTLVINPVCGQKCIKHNFWNMSALCVLFLQQVCILMRHEVLFGQISQTYWIDPKYHFYWPWKQFLWDESADFNPYKIQRFC